MTTELEQEFYKIFEIEPKMLCNCEFKNLYDYRIEYGSDVCDYTESKIKEPCKICKKAKQKIPLYPEITDRKLLEMICILSAYNYIFEDLKADDIEQLKEEIIKLFFDYPLVAEEEKAKIQQLFKEGK